MSIARAPLDELRRQLSELAADWLTTAAHFDASAKRNELADAIRSISFKQKAEIYESCSRQVVMLLDPPPEQEIDP